MFAGSETALSFEIQKEIKEEEANQIAFTVSEKENDHEENKGNECDGNDCDCHSPQVTRMIVVTVQVVLKNTQNKLWETHIKAKSYRAI